MVSADSKMARCRFGHAERPFMSNLDLWIVMLNAPAPQGAPFIQILSPEATGHCSNFCDETLAREVCEACKKL